MAYNCRTISQKILNNLEPRVKTLVARRFGLNGGEMETLEAIGQDFKITRERVRQIVEVGLEKCRQTAGQNFNNVFKDFFNHIDSKGGLRREDLLLSELGDSKYNNDVYFLLTLSNQFERFSGDKSFYPFWAVKKDSRNISKKVSDYLQGMFGEKKQPASFEVLQTNIHAEIPNLGTEAIQSYIEVSKKIMKGPGGFYGLREWAEINPRFIKDKAYLVLKQENEPLHFTQVAEFIQKLNIPENSRKQVHTQTVHNELIKDQRFVLVGRGLYALKEWGYQAGVVKDVIVKTLQASSGPLSKTEIVSKVLEQRQVKKNTILLNLQDKKYFLRDSNDRYSVKEA
ncbi:MAG: sigma factor-like helix-turn-helix DNA-binding protein [Candidatus Parcubacteria bacterium]|nr:sigma factor-like helix-turn-helix DNA-binding protein [Candidatus Parcubacteria bacterium]